MYIIHISTDANFAIVNTHICTSRNDHLIRQGYARICMTPSNHKSMP